MGVPSHLLVAAMCHRASVNTVAMRTVSILYSQVMDVGCFSHTLNLVEEHMKTPILDDFIKSWASLFSHSPKSRLFWRTQTGSSLASYSATRWRSKLCNKYSSCLVIYPTFLSSDGLPHVTSSKLLEILNDSVKIRKLKMELAITIHSMEPFAKATYALEGMVLLLL